MTTNESILQECGIPGTDWIIAFRKKHPDLIRLKTPEEKRAIELALAKSPSWKRRGRKVVI